MYERMQLELGRLMTISWRDLKRQEGQGATEYAMVIGFVIVGLTLTLGLLGTSIENFLSRVAGKIDGMLKA